MLRGQILVQLIFRFGLWSDRSATIVQTIVRLECFPDHLLWVASRH